jgi:hypothetical protein
LKRWLCAALALVSVGLVSAPPATPHSAARSSGSAWCNGSESWRAARASVGEPIRVRARVVRSYYASTTSGRPTFIDLGHAYPSRSRVTILIWGRNRVNFPRAPELMFRPGTLVCAQGVVELYRGVPEIEVVLYDSRDRLLSF